MTLCRVPVCFEGPRLRFCVLVPLPGLDRTSLMEAGWDASDWGVWVVAIEELRYMKDQKNKELVSRREMNDF